MIESNLFVSTPVPAKTHAEVKAYAALNNIRIPEAYEKLISFALDAPSVQKNKV